jgi:UDP-glucose 4-epimerase
MIILIIGSKGFIGSHTVDYFSASYVVYTCDVVTDYVTPNYFQITASQASFEEVFSYTKPDVCINCSGAASVPNSLLHPERDYELNVHNTFKILEAIRKYCPSCRFIYLSSAAVYGNPQVLPVAESAALQPVSPYGEHKKMAEELCASFHRHFGLQTLSLRLFSVYGPRLQKQLFWEVYKKCLASEAIDVLGTGAESRDYIYVKEVVRVIDLMIRHARFDGTACNVANGQEVRIDTAIRQFTEALGWHGEVRYSGTQRAGDPLRWYADIHTIRSLGYHPSYTLSEGLKEYVSWLNEKR